MKANYYFELNDKYGATNYYPLPVVLTKGDGVWVKDIEGKSYLDMLSAYSALNHGHRHPRLLKALTEQAGRVTLTSRAFHHDQLGLFYEKVAQITGKEMVLPMNTGVEAVETAIKAIRRWGYQVKGIAPDQAEIIVVNSNFHGRTITAISFSTDEQYRHNFGPMTPGFKVIPFGDAQALAEAITPNTAGFLLEPIQGEAGVIIPPDGYLVQVAKICRENKVLLAADEIQTGLGRTGKMFACDWEQVTPDLYILGKALGGGIYPVSAVAANREILGLFEPGSHGSTFGGNPLACAVATEALSVLLEENLVVRSLQLGEYMLSQLRKLEDKRIKEIRGRGLFIGMELVEPSRLYCELLMQEGILCKETHERTIRFAPPLVITKEEIDIALQKVAEVLSRNQ